MYSQLLQQHLTQQREFVSAESSKCTPVYKTTLDMILFWKTPGKYSVSNGRPEIPCKKFPFSHPHSHILFVWDFPFVGFQRITEAREVGQKRFQRGKDDCWIKKGNRSGKSGKKTRQEGIAWLTSNIYWAFTMCRAFSQTGHSTPDKTPLPLGAQFSTTYYTTHWTPRNRKSHRCPPRRQCRRKQPHTVPCTSLPHPTCVLDLPLFLLSNPDRLKLPHQPSL